MIVPIKLLIQEIEVHLMFGIFFIFNRLHACFSITRLNIIILANVFMFDLGSIAANENRVKSFEGHAYEVISVPMTWSEAEEYAKQKLGMLAKINSLQENVFLQSLMSQITTVAQDGGGAKYFWLGGSDSVLEANWQWVDGTKIDSSSITNRALWGQGPGFETGSSEPDNFMGNQDCLAMGLETWPKGAEALNSLGVAGQWNDISCSNELGFVIEYDVGASFKDGALQVKHLTVGDKKYSASFQLASQTTYNPNERCWLLSSVCFKLTAADETSLPTTNTANYFSDNILKITKLEYEGKVYELDLELIDSENLIFEATQANLASSIQTFPSDSWITATPDSVGMDTAKLQQAIDYAFNDVMVNGTLTPQNTQGVVIIRHGAIVAEKYASDSSKESIATSWSTAKSFTSALMGIAIDKGYVSSEYAPAAEFITEWAGDDRKNITIKNLLQMSSGLIEGGTSGYGDGAIMYIGLEDEEGVSDPDRPVDNVLYSIDRAIDPNRAPWLGAAYSWNYQNADSQLLGEIIERATNTSIYDFAQDVLFNKLGINAGWWTDEFGNYMSYCCLDMTTRNFARFGLLYAREGKWNAEQIVSQEWVIKSTAPSVWLSDSITYGYGYQWWPDDSGDWFFSIGSRMNNIYIHPSLDIVVVRNSSLELVGEGKSRANGAYHDTKFPAVWDHNAFFQPIIDSTKCFESDYQDCE
jgi:CubicO group peptidase (beta-lactamase class C family)